MRITAGVFRGRRLSAPEGLTTRPTADRTRQAVFNILEHAPWSQGLQGLRVLDLFAGSGALGLEAISRGADFCLFVETAEVARGALGQNIEALGLSGRTRIHRRDAARLDERPGSAGEAFDLAFLDPPYGRGLGERALTALAQGGWLKPGAACVLERGPGEPTLAPAGYTVLDIRSYGVAELAFLSLDATIAGCRVRP